MAPEHWKDDFPVTVGALLVEDIAIGQGIAVVRALMDFVMVIDPGGAHRLVQSLDHRDRRVAVF